MDRQTWNRIDNLLQSALEVPIEERDAFLQRMCAGDESLQREISSLLSSLKDADGFLETPAIEEAARALGVSSVLESSVPWPPSPGQTISHYRMIEKLGSGGMGLVYKAEDTRLHRFVALKFLSETLAGHPQALQRLRGEAQAASALNHPHICTIYDIGEEHEQVFIAMEYVEGETLRPRIGGKPLPFDQVFDFALQILDVLDTVHRKGIIHRDIKPANVFITHRGDVKVLDFGLAKLTDVDGRPSDSRDTHWPCDDHVASEHLTRSTITLGTIAYISPEQARGERLDARSDLFSFGALLYEMVTGHVAFKDSTKVVILQAMESYTPIPVSQLNPAIPAGLVHVIGKALERDREKRYQTAREISADLKRIELDQKRESRETTPRRLRQFTVGAATGLLLAATSLFVWLALTGRFPGHRSPVLTDRDSILLADFTNSTGDPVFDATLRQALTIQLEQSPFLSLVSDARIKDTERMMGLHPDERLTIDVAREVCQRTSSVAVIDGSIANLGNQYIVGLKAVNCHTGDSFAGEEAIAEGKEHVLKALGDAAGKLRTKLGESLASVERFDTPVDQATTPSLEALLAYSLSTHAFVMQADAISTVPLLQRAISIDPNFALAYANLADRYFFVGETNAAAANMRRAFELRHRLSEREKLAVECGFYAEVLGNMEKARQVAEIWVHTYPRDGPARGRASWIDNATGRYVEATDQVLAAVHFDASLGIPYFTLVHQYLDLDRLDDARRIAEEAQAKHFDSPLLRFGLYKLGFLENDVALMAKQVAWAKGNGGAEHVMLAFESDTAAYRGQLRKARELHDRAVASALGAGERQAAARYEGEAALREALFGNASEMSRHAGAALRLSTARDTEYTAAMALALSGAAGVRARCEALLNDLGRRFPEDTTVQFNYLPAIQAQLAVTRKRGGNAIETLQKATRYELGSPGFHGQFVPVALYPVYVRGQAYLADRQAREAAAQFQKIIDHRGIVFNEPIGALAHLGLARAYAHAGDKGRSRAKYEEFFALWRDADPDIPILRRAKTEYTRVR